MEGIPKIGGVPGSPVHQPESVSRVRDREARRERKQSFDAELEREAEGGEPAPKPAEPRREPHPPADEESGNTLDVIA
jgi:hypothetical protein